MTILLKRVLKVGFSFKGQAVEYDDLYITASGMKCVTSSKNNANVVIANLSQEMANYLMVNTSPYSKNKDKIGMYILVGRETLGITKFFVGDVSTAEPYGDSDQYLKINCVTGGNNRFDTVFRSLDDMQKLSTIAKKIAEDNQLKLNFKIPDKNVMGYSYRGSKVDQINELQKLADANVYQNNELLNVLPYNKSLNDQGIKLTDDLILSNSLSVSDEGLSVKILYDARVDISCRVEIESESRSIYNGIYVVNKINFQLSNQDRQFYLQLALTKQEQSSE
jgi:hypothetical protein